ncbi:MAG: substrate-binding domain-containing protein [Verrucomicrobiia bacterium]
MNSSPLVPTLGLLALLLLTGCESTSSRSATPGPAAVLAAPLPTYTPSGDYLQGTLRLGAPSFLAPYLTELSTTFKRLHWGAYTDLLFPANVPGEFLAGKITVAVNTRPLSESEKLAFTERFNGPPLEFRVGQEPIDLFAHPSNPVTVLTPEQIASIFGSARSPISTWGQAGASAGWAGFPINPVAPAPGSELTRAFQWTGLNGSSFSPRVMFLENSAQVVRRVEQDPGALGFGNARLTGGSIKAIGLQIRGQKFAIFPTRENLMAGLYPYRSFYYLYVNPRSRPMDPLVREFVRLALSQEGTPALGRTGAFPLDGNTARQSLVQLDAFDRL